MNRLTQTTAKEEIAYAIMREQGCSVEEALETLIQARLAQPQAFLIQKTREAASNRLEMLYEVKAAQDMLTSQVEAIKPFERARAEKDQMQGTISLLQLNQEELKEKLGQLQDNLRKENLERERLVRKVEQRQPKPEDTYLQDQIIECGKKVCSHISNQGSN